MLPGAMASAMVAAIGKTKKAKILGAIGYIASLAVPIAINFAITKDQKNASRVANMEAIKELDDYRYFASNQIMSSGGNKSLKENSKESKISKANHSPLLQKMLNQ